MKPLLCLLVLSCVVSSELLKAATFSIDNIHVHEQIQTDGDGIMVQNPAFPANPNAKIYIPQVEVNVRVSEDAQSKNLLAKAYFFDVAGKVLATQAQPSVAMHFMNDGVRGYGNPFSWPTIVPANTQQELFFPLPSKLPANWSMVVVVGNSNGVVAAPRPMARNRC